MLVEQVKQGSTDCYGEASLSENVISIEKPGRGTSHAVLEQTFWHEAMHFVLHRLGFDDLGNNEQFVDLMGQALYQIQTTRVERT